MENLPGISRAMTKRGLQPWKPAVTLQPRTYQDILHGTNLIANAIRPTLGPLPRLVVLERLKRTEAPEFLDDGATIARRIIQVEPRGSDIGAMLIRHALWQMHQEAGDGATTMAVLYQAILREGIRYVTQFDCNAMLLRAGLEKGLSAVLDCLRREAGPLTGKLNIEKIAGGMCQGDLEMAKMMGEIFDMVGPDGMIVVEGWNKLGLEREYIEGTYWKLSGWLSRLFVTDKADKRAVFDGAALLISDMDIKDPHQLVPVLERCVKAGIKKLVIIARSMSDAVIGLLVNNNQAKTIETLAVRTPKGMEIGRVTSIEDLAVLTGGRIFYAAAYTSFDAFQVTDLGHARRAWATESLFGVYGGKGDPRQIRKHIAAVRGMLSSAEGEHDKGELQARLGRLHGGTVILRVGAIHETEREARKAIAERAVTGIRHALLGGVVPGGGSALIHAQAAVMGLPVEHDDDAMAYKILARALEEPMRAIARNAGYVPDVIVEKVKAAPDGCGFDAITGRIVEMRQTGILDALIVLEKALQIAVSGAAMALTTDVIVHHRKPVESLEP
ncbi:MAG: chaperonin GroEL [Chloroflexi bacterium]|nr:chaperonin GroEL [Chloroflexota bacterium]